MRYAAFLRAINIGNRRVKMDRLRDAFEGLGLGDVSTYIASGNVLFEATSEAAKLEGRIEKMLERELGFDVVTFVRTERQLRRLVDEVEAQLGSPVAGESEFVTFLRKPPSKAVRSKVEAMSTKEDILRVSSNHLLWLRRGPLMEATVDGLGLEKTLGQPGTQRNANTVKKILAKLDA